MLKILWTQDSTVYWPLLISFLLKFVTTTVTLQYEIFHSNTYLLFSALTPFYDEQALRTFCRPRASLRLIFLIFLDPFWSFSNFNVVCQLITSGFPLSEKNNPYKSAWKHRKSSRKLDWQSADLLVRVFDPRNGRTFQIMIVVLLASPTVVGGFIRVPWRWDSGFILVLRFPPPVEVSSQ